MDNNVVLRASKNKFGAAWDTGSGFTIRKVYGYALLNQVQKQEPQGTPQMKGHLVRLKVIRRAPEQQGRACGEAVHTLPAKHLSLDRRQYERGLGVELDAKEQRTRKVTAQAPSHTASSSFSNQVRSEHPFCRLS